LIYGGDDSPPYINYSSFLFYTLFQPLITFIIYAVIVQYIFQLIRKLVKPYFLLLYLNFKNFTESMIVMISLPFAIVGGVWFIYLLGYDMSIAVGVGFIALAGVAAETGVIPIMSADTLFTITRC
jgi:Cu/Ag efflux pump CusA